MHWNRLMECLNAVAAYRSHGIKLTDHVWSCGLVISRGLSIVAILLMYTQAVARYTSQLFYVLDSREIFFPTSVVGPVYYTGSDLRSIKAVDLPTLGFKQCCSSWGLPVQNHRTNVRLVKVTTDVAGTGSLYSPSCSWNKWWLSQNPVKMWRALERTNELCSFIQARS